MIADCRKSGILGENHPAPGLQLIRCPGPLYFPLTILFTCPENLWFKFYLGQQLKFGEAWELGETNNNKIRLGGMEHIIWKNSSFKAWVLTATKRSLTMLKPQGNSSSEKLLGFTECKINIRHRRCEFASDKFNTGLKNMTATVKGHHRRWHRSI